MNNYLYNFILIILSLSIFENALAKDDSKKNNHIHERDIDYHNFPKDELYKEALKYFYGRGVDVDKSKSFALYREAAEAGHKKAQNNLALSYEMGYGVNQDQAKAIFWYRKSAEQGFSVAQNNLANILIKQEDTIFEGFDWYKKSAEQGYAEAQNNLGTAYHKGVGTNIDIDKAVLFYKKAIEQGYTMAAYNLGVLYYKNRNYKSSIKYHKIAADDKNSDSLNYLANMYLKGQGVKQDYFISSKLFKKALDLGNESAKLYVKSRESACVKKDIDPKEKLYSCIISAEAGYAPAQHNLATYYHYGDVLDKDPLKAFYWSEKGALQGYPLSQIGMIYYYENEAPKIDKKGALANMATEELLREIDNNDLNVRDKVLKIKNNITGEHILSNHFRSYFWAYALSLNPKIDKLSGTQKVDVTAITNNIFNLKKKLQAISPEINKKYQKLEECSAKLYTNKESFSSCYSHTIVGEINE